jgi:hypothetical protein
MTLNQLNILPVFRSLVVNFRRLGGLILTKRSFEKSRSMTHFVPVGIILNPYT